MRQDFAVGKMRAWEGEENEKEGAEETVDWKTDASVPSMSL